ncbi:hypothetical protein JK217_11480 [Gluconobacter kondonii]|uniref:hypothetical protein n=1 Tax=Gluconobacter kondonii TaxID=941463 RepID=UPI001B8AFE09|nr:hypothetical protein [Gluconobacter kondonii]MBS1078358.1 hypothetical protein [Gluconobacter kondonii]
MSKKLWGNHKKTGVLYFENFEEVPIEKNLKIENEYIPSKKKEFDDNVLNDFYERGISEGKRIEKEECNKNKEIIYNRNKLLSNSLLSIEKQIISGKRQISEEICGIMINSLLNLFPSLIKKYGEKESEIILKKISKVIDQNSCLNLNCSKEFFCRIKKLSPIFSEKRININLDENLKNGDFELFWDMGSLSRSANKEIEKIISEMFFSNQE